MVTPKTKARSLTFGQLMELEDLHLQLEEGVRREQARQAQKPVPGHPPTLKLKIAGDAQNAPHHDEPHVSFTNRDRFGLAFSGGGMRSASFNLGVLQALADKGLLTHLDYFSTISGGGYLGGFWSALRHQYEKKHPSSELKKTDPAQVAASRADALSSDLLKAGRARSPSEPPQIRHLREFSMFLMPRLGFAKAETWAGIVAVLGGMLPTLLTLAAVVWLASTLFVWLATAMASSMWFGMVVVLAGLFALNFVAEALWQRWQDGPWIRSSWFWGFVSASALASACSWAALFTFKFPELFKATVDWSPKVAMVDVVWRSSDVAWVLFTPALALAAPALALLLLVRPFVATHDSRELVTGLDRAVSRALASALICAACAGLWEAVRASVYWRYQLGVLGVGSGGLFLWLRQWLAEKPEDTRLSRVVPTALSWFKPLVPQLLAAIAALVLVGSLVLGFQVAGGALRWATMPLALIALGAAVVVFLFLKWVDPSAMGLHAFYRWRIARSFLGAARTTRSEVPSTLEQADDDFTFDDLEQAQGPLHLVCCAANDLQGDALKSLRRGARSATISPLALSIGGFARTGHALSMGSVLTASGAALNSQMGGFSVHFGPAVAFLMSAFNLRLGLWVPHPLTPGRHPGGEWPGWRLFLEALGRTRCDAVLDDDNAATDFTALHQTVGTPRSSLTDVIDPLEAEQLLFLHQLTKPLCATKAPSTEALASAVAQLQARKQEVAASHSKKKKGVEPDAAAGWTVRPEAERLEKALTSTSFDPEQFASDCDVLGNLCLEARKRRYAAADLHLSDGGHFENLALYELVRRHCRYIIASDAGADPEAAFDDLGNAIRRIREDFSVEIEIDVSALRPVNGVSAQQVAIGTIHYDGLAGSDKGTLLYLRPTLVEGVPADVLQYRARNATFPQEGTADQFYDEAQWESYRRLGEYLMAVALHVDETGWRDKPSPVDALFLAVRQRWHSAPSAHTETFLAFTGRCSALESEIREKAPLWFRLEMFPELRVVLADTLAADAKAKPDLLRRDADGTNAVVVWVMQIAQLMEDVWLAAQLDTYWSHPLNEGWMAYFHRWAQTPSFRTWWPLLRPIYSEGFRNFVKHRFHLKLEGEGGGKLVLSEILLRDEASQKLGPSLCATTGTHALLYTLTLNDGGAPGRIAPVHVGALWFDLDSTLTPKVARWKSSQFMVPPWLVGAGIAARFLRDALQKLDDAGCGRLEVAIEGADRDPGSRMDRASTIAFYKSRGFTYLDGSLLEWLTPG